MVRHSLLAGFLVAGSLQAVPDVPWWGNLIMAVVSVVMAFFSGGGTLRKTF